MRQSKPKNYDMIPSKKFGEFLFARYHLAQLVEQCGLLIHTPELRSTNIIRSILIGV